MALSVKKGSFNAPVATGNSAVTGVGFQPKALILWATANVVAGYADHQYMAMGFATGSSNRKSVAFAYDDATGVQNTNTGMRLADLAITILNSGTPAVGAEADFVSFDADGFTLNWTTAGAGKDYIVHYLALGGADLTNAFVGQITCPTSTGSQGITGVGFQPDALLFIAGRHTASGNATEASLNIGAVSSPTARGTMSVSGRDNVATSTNGRRQNTDKLLNILGGAADHQRAGDLTSFDADGFTVNWSVGTTAHLVPFLALKGGRFHVGNETQRTSTGTKATTGVGFQPKGLFCFGWNRIASASTDTVESTISIGASDGTTEGSSWGAAADLVTTPNAQVSTVTDKVLRHSTLNSTTDSEADLATFDADGFTFDWTTVDATAREFVYLAMADAVAADNILPQGGAPAAGISPHPACDFSRSG